MAAQLGARFTILFTFQTEHPTAMVKALLGILLICIPVFLVIYVVGRLTLSE